MKKRAIILAVITAMLTVNSGYAANTVSAEEMQKEESQASEIQAESGSEEASQVPIKPLSSKVVSENPYMAKADANIHHDCYNTDSTDEVLPVGIYPEINVSYEKVNANASPAIFFDSYGHAVVPLLGGLAIRDINADETQTEGYFSPKQHDSGDSELLFFC